MNRPFDDQTQERIHLESEAVTLILARCQGSDWRLLTSEAVRFEVSQILDEERKQKVMLLDALAASQVIITKDIEHRALELTKCGFKAFDALHVACAEAGAANVLLTTDDRLTRKAQKQDDLTTKLMNPVSWLMEVTEHGSL